MYRTVSVSMDTPTSIARGNPDVRNCGARMRTPLLPNPSIEPYFDISCAVVRFDGSYDRRRRHLSLVVRPST